jgi:glycosyltransferase involved in cell wall biosynthesis
LPRSPRTLKIVYVGTLPPHQDGGAIAGARLLAGLATRGHSVRALAPITEEALNGGDPFRDQGIEVTRFLVPYDETEPNAPPSDDYRLLQGERIRSALPSLISRGRPDVVVAGRETFAWDVPDVCRTHALPCVLILRGTTTAGVVSGTYPRARELLKQYRKADLIVVPAGHMGRLLESTGHSKVKVIPNSVDLRMFRPRPKPRSLLRELAIQRDHVVVAHVSNLKRVKRPLDVVGSAERALAENARLTFVVVGDGPCRPSMVAACAQKGISEHFRFTGWVDHREVPEYINLADIVVMPSEFEAQAGVYLQTQACARVLVASDVAGAREVIVDGETGLLHRLGDIDDLASKTLLAAGDSRLRADIGCKARDATLAHSQQDAVAAYDAAIAEVVRQHRA